MYMMRFDEQNQRLSKTKNPPALAGGLEKLRSG